ncbi:MAG: hypothetical protein CSB44_12040 [Gammaproteobacteria bacterium]|nr:MAG: hypothetical protein CSB44_12040 [Gammaproteobacteria bacterium]
MQDWEELLGTLLTRGESECRMLRRTAAYRVAFQSMACNGINPLVAIEMVFIGQQYADMWE